MNDMKLKNENEIIRERYSFESFCFENMKKNKNVYYFRRREYRFYIFLGTKFPSIAFFVVLEKFARLYLREYEFNYF